MEQQEPDRKVVYHAKMEALYNTAAANIFKEQYFPADPFDGVLIDAAFLEIPDLVAVVKAALALKNEGNAAIAENLIYFRGQYTTPAVRVNCLWLDDLRQRKHQICIYLQEMIFYEQKIKDKNDPQLLEYLRQVKEVLAFEVEVEK